MAVIGGLFMFFARFCSSSIHTNRTGDRSHCQFHYHVPWTVGVETQASNQKLCFICLIKKFFYISFVICPFVIITSHCRILHFVLFFILVWFSFFIRPW